MRVLVCGSRDFDDGQFVWDVLHGQEKHGIECVIHGGARGADAHGEGWARANHLPVERFPADWNRHGNKAGPIRNQQMLDDGKPDLVLAFVNKPLGESRGTADMVRRATAAGLRTCVLECFAQRVFAFGGSQ